MPKQKSKKRLQDNELLSSDFENLTRKKPFTYPEPPISQFNLYNKVITNDVHTDINKSNIIKFAYDVETYELARFAEFPITLKLKLIARNTENNNLGWVRQNDRSYTIFPNLEADTLFSDIDVYVDSKRMPNFLNENHIYFSRLNEIFNVEKPDNDLKPYSNTSVFEDITDQEAFRQMERMEAMRYLDRTSCGVAGSVTFRCRWPGVFPFHSQCKSTKSASGIKIGPPFLPSSTRISVMLKKRTNWRKYLLLKNYRVNGARYDGNPGADLDLDFLDIEFQEVSLSLECWRPALDSQLKMYKQIELLEYITEIPQIM